MTTSIRTQQTRLTRRGWLGKKIKQIYLRDDISCGFQLCADHSKQSNPFSHELLSDETIFFIDTSTLLNQTDIIYNCQAMKSLIVLQSQVQELKKKYVQKYNAFKNFVESTMNSQRQVYVFPDTYHREIRLKMTTNYQSILARVILWYQGHIKDQGFNLNIKLITSQFDEQISELKSIQTIGLIDFLKQADSNLLDFLGFDDFAQIFTEKVFPTHIEPAQAVKKIKCGLLFEGKFMEDRSYMKIMNNTYPIKIINNRAIYGDVVAIQLQTTDKWVQKFAKTLQDNQQQVTIDPNEQITIQDTSAFNNIISFMQQNQHLMPVGHVTSVLKRKTKFFCGTVNEQKIIYQSQKDKFQLMEFIPVNNKYPTAYIRTFNSQAFKNQRIMVGFDIWPQQSEFPLCHYIRTIGKVGDQRAQGDVILLQHNVQIAEFSKMAYACLPPAGDSFKIPPQEFQRRLDLRGINVVSIDPPGCKDIDDALHCYQLENGNLSVGVHIADVSYYVRPDTALDLQARNRSTTVYLVDRRTDMLPKLLTQNLCSLRSDVERLAFSTIWEMDKDANIINTKYCKTIIKSRRAFTYKQAQQLKDSNSQSDIANSIRNLNMLAKKFKKRRIDNGALQLASTQVKVTLSEETHSATDVELYSLVQTNSLIEQFMLLANISVAQRIYQRFPSLSILRRHSQPKAAELQLLRQILKQQHFQLNYQNSKSLADSLDRIKRTQDPFFNQLVRIMTTRCMNQATYFCSADFDTQEFYHYGLAAAFYTHFTSPIRRYADILVHRLLAAAIDLEPLPNFMINKLKMTKICDNMNMRNRMARYASRASSDYYTYQFFKDRNVTEKAIITAIAEDKITLMLIKYGLQSQMLFDEKQKLMTKDLNKGKTILSKCSINNRQYHLFQYVDVQVQVQLKGFHKKMNIKIVS